MPAPQTLPICPFSITVQPPSTIVTPSQAPNMGVLAQPCIAERCMLFRVVATPEGNVGQCAFGAMLDMMNGLVTLNANTYMLNVAIAKASGIDVEQLARESQEREAAKQKPDPN